MPRISHCARCLICSPGRGSRQAFGIRHNQVESNCRFPPKNARRPKNLAFYPKEYYENHEELCYVSVGILDSSQIKKNTPIHPESS